MIREPSRTLSVCLGVSVFLGLLAGAAVAKQEQKPEQAAAPKHFEAHRISSPIKIDGRLDEAAWTEATPIPLPVETRPGENVAAPVKTECFILYDRNHLYIGFRAHDPDPSRIRARLTDRDRAFQDDFVGVVLDTFNDERRAFEFFVNPLGVQMDLFNDEVGGSEDETWDAIWNSAGRITADGFETEMMIPFSSLRFPDVKSVQTWGIDVIRFYPRQHRYRLSSQPLRRDISCYLCQISKLTEIEGVQPAKDLELDPTVTGTRSDSRPDFPQGELQNGDVKSEIGLTASWGITPNVILNGTLNPDFSQVEADALQLNVNEQFALFYPEKRPFFLEGADFFATPLQAVFTRNVADPDWGVKVSGKQNRHAMGVFVTQDASTSLLFPGSEGSSSTMLDLQTTDAVLRYRHDVGENSAIGALVTSRAGGGYHNRVAGLDGLWRPSDTDAIHFQYLASDSEYPGQVSIDFDQPFGSFNDRAYLLNYDHSSRNWQWYTRYQNLGRDFRADMGFLPQVDLIEKRGGIARKWWGDEEDWWIENQVGVELAENTNQAGDLLARHTEAWLFFQGPRQFYGLIDAYRGSQSFNGVVFDRNYVYVEGGAQVSRSVRLDFNGRAGDQIDFANTRQASELRANPHVRLDLGRHLRADLDYLHATLDEDNARLFTARLSELRLVYQFNLRSFVRAILQYTDVHRDPDLYVDAVEAHSELLFTQLLYSYKLNPQTVLFLGYSSTDQGVTGIDRLRTNQTYFVKLGYAWRL